MARKAEHLPYNIPPVRRTSQGDLLCLLGIRYFTAIGTELLELGGIARCTQEQIFEWVFYLVFDRIALKLNLSSKFDPGIESEIMLRVNKRSSSAEP
jgi:hypothetical protein